MAVARIIPAVGLLVAMAMPAICGRRTAADRAGRGRQAADAQRRSGALRRAAGRRRLWRLPARPLHDGAQPRLPRAEAGDPAAQTLVAEILSRGLGVARNEAEAAKWYQLAAEQGVPEAQFQYALLLLDGRFVKKDSRAPMR